ncbi:MAG: polysaccharide pyruvyl transferase CsaB [Lawsonibacter sp.]|nr:polysaccharide pyruvyl transferase CsaB [Lawsonibacter sp.]
MKILMATMGLDIGGAETHIVELSKQLRLRGHQVVVVSNGGVYVPEIAAAGIRHFPAPMHRRSARDMLRSLRILSRVIREERPDVVHAHARIPAFLCGLLQKRLHFPFVTTCHGVYQVSGALKLLSNWGEHTLTVSEDIRDYLERKYGIPPQRITLTINGIDTQKFSPAVSGAGVREELGLGDGLVIGHVSRLTPATSVTARQLLELAPRLDRELPGVRLLIVGGGEDFPELAAQAEEVNRRLGRACAVMTGPRTDISELLAACDLFAGVSRAALEAMSAGRPAVLSGAQGHTGLFVPRLLDKAVDTNFCCRSDPPATPDRLLEDLLAAARLSPEQRRQLGEYGREVVQERYSLERMTQDSLEMYERVRRRKYHVVMSGYYGFSNAGDDAILQSIHQSIREASGEVEVTVLSNDPQQTARCYGMKALSRFRFPTVFRALWGCDALISGGGSLLQDRTSTRSILYYLSIMRCAQLLGKPVMLYANGIGPVDKPGNRRRVKRAVERAAVVTLRDRSSAQELREMGVAREDLHVTADPVFRLECAPPGRSARLLRAAGLEENTPFAAVSVREWPGTGDFPAGLARLCDHLRRTYGLEILFLLMQPHKDREAAGQIRQAMEEPSSLLDVPSTPQELMGVLGRSKLCLAMRLHTLIFAARMSVPTLGLVYDPKVSSYLRELDMPSAGDVCSFDSAAAIGQADRLMAQYSLCRRRLQEKSAALAQAARENERLLLELLERGEAKR